MFGTVNERGHTKTGGPRLKIDGKWMYPDRRCNLDGIEPGGYVEYETSLGGNQGTLVILNRIRPAPRPAGMPNGTAPQSAAVEEASLRFISNVVGSAITAGVIKDPNQVGPWSISALRALKSLEIAQKLKDVLDSNPEVAKSVKAAIEPEFDDSAQLNEEIPDSFYEGLPPPKSPATRW